MIFINKLTSRPLKHHVNFLVFPFILNIVNCGFIHEHVSFFHVFDRFRTASLDNTTTWLQAAASEEAPAVRAQSDSPSPDSQSPVSAIAVLNRAYIRLLHCDPQDQKYPEVSHSLQNDIASPFHLSDILLIMREYSLLITLLHV